jgi:hypothetical protein
MSRLTRREKLLTLVAAGALIIVAVDGTVVAPWREAVSARAERIAELTRRSVALAPYRGKGEALSREAASLEQRLADRPAPRPGDDAALADTLRRMSEAVDGANLRLAGLTADRSGGTERVSLSALADHDGLLRFLYALDRLPTGVRSLSIHAAAGPAPYTLAAAVTLAGEMKNR